MAGEFKRVVKWGDAPIAPPCPPEQFDRALHSLDKPEPEPLVLAAKAKKHPLHQRWYVNKTEGEWAHIARVDDARKLIRNLNEVVTIGGKTVETRAVEFIRLGTSREYTGVYIYNILDDPDMLVSYLREVQRLNEQAAEKLGRVMMMIKEAEK